MLQKITCQRTRGTIGRHVDILPASILNGCSHGAIRRQKWKKKKRREENLRHGFYLAFMTGCSCLLSPLGQPVTVRTVALLNNSCGCGKEKVMCNLTFSFPNGESFHFCLSYAYRCNIRIYPVLIEDSGKIKKDHLYKSYIFCSLHSISVKY